MVVEAAPHVSPLWARALRLLIVVLCAAVFLVGMIDSLRAWRTETVLRKVANQAAKFPASSPLNVQGCKESIPCPVEQAAASARDSLMGSGFPQAACLDPHKPAFSGVLIWAFSCDGSSSCPTDAESDTVCVKVDMTAVSATFAPSTRVTVQCPHAWGMNAVLKLIPGRRLRAYPNNLAVSALLPDSGAS